MVSLLIIFYFLYFPVISLLFLCRFLLEVVRVSVSEIRSVRLTLLNSGLSSESGKGQHTPDMLVHLSHHLLLTLLHLTLTGIYDYKSFILKQYMIRR